LNFLDLYFKKTQNQKSRKSIQREPSCTGRIDRQTDRTKLIVAFRNFTKAPKNTLLMIYKYRMQNFTYYVRSFLRTEGLRQSFNFHTGAKIRIKSVSKICHK